MVNCRPPRPHGTVTLVGVAVAEGGLVATTADASAGVRQLDRRRPAGARQRPRWWRWTARPTWRWSTCPRTCPSPRSPTTAPSSPARGPHPGLRAGSRRRARRPLHPGRRHRRRRPWPTGPAAGMAASPRPRRRPLPAARSPRRRTPAGRAAAVVGPPLRPGPPGDGDLPSLQPRGRRGRRPALHDKVVHWLAGRLRGATRPGAAGPVVATVESVTPGGPADQAAPAPGRSSWP